MRTSPVFVVALLLAVCCAHSGDPGRPAGRIGDVRFDRDSMVGPRVMVARASDGSWRGRWHDELVDVSVRDGVIEGDGYRSVITHEPRYVFIEDGADTLVFQRVDGGAIPHELVLPLWFFYRTLHSPNRVDPFHTCVPVDPIGTVLVLWFPGPSDRYEVGRGPGCRVTFTDRWESADLTAGPPPR
jgi:hypothetical protein